MSASTGETEKGHRGEVVMSKTCQNCFSLKIRCDRTQGAGICDRCARLGKQCLFRPARRRDNSAKRDTRIQALEAQVQNLLRTQNPAHTVQQPLPTVNEERPSTTITPTPSSISIPLPSVPTEQDVIDEDILSIERADTLVEMYRAEMMPHFPFIIIPPHETGRGMRHERPFLFLTILSVASFHDLAAQEKLVERLKRMVTEKIFYGGDDCLKLEYLQGLLIILAWNQYHGQSKFYSQYLHLAISIAVDMRFDRKPLQPKPKHHNDKRDPLVKDNHPGPQAWGSGEQRAAAGIFYLSSTISRLLDKMNMFPCTKMIEDGCLSLGQTREYRTDKDLYHVIKLQQIIETTEALGRDATSDIVAQEAYLRMRDELEAFRTYLNSDFSDSHLLFMQFHTAKLFLHQVFFFERNLQTHPHCHLPLLTSGLESAKSFLDLYLWLPPKSEMALSNSEWIQLSFGVTQAAKFAIIAKAPGVEMQTRELRHRLNIEHVFRHLVLRIGALVGRAGMGGDKKRDVFLYYEQRVRKIQNWYEGMSRAMGSLSPGSVNQESPQSQQQQSQQQRQRSPYAASLSSSPHSLQHLHTPSQVPLSLTFSHQQSAFSNPHAPPPPLQHQQLPVSYSAGDMLQASTTPVMNAYSTFASSSPSLAFPDLMSAPGWDALFAVPMEDTGWMIDVGQGYDVGTTGMDVGVTPTSDGSWGDGSRNL
ncbi:hypothetical protein CC80DRAFT_542800 [Byssothecium circinans]|uniref:Zn(2)-C6 fungal-type domain-containing protein n=1 Tax=Byssothecium circinans TaxID=147558 RepID=A0A6A5UC33_9PLEO|nr:hypothetical protein CC80DRAFT_542800 [Byssothecium circinans]